MGAVGGLIDDLRARSGDVPFLDRLDHFRGRLIASIIVFIVATVLGFYLAMNFNVLGIFTAPIVPYLNGERLKYLSPMDPFMVTMKMGICIGFVLALPYILSQLWGTVSPLMRPAERKLMLPAMVASVVLFLGGALFCYLTVVPVMLRFSMGFQTESLEEWIVVGSYLSVVLKLLLAFGLTFQLPVVILLLTLLGVVTPAFLASKRRYAIAIITIVSALATPPDLGSMVLMMIPVWLLYEISIVMSRAVLASRVAVLPAQEG